MPAPPPLKGIRVLEFAGLAPGPFAGLILADAGASVLRVDRATPVPVPTADLLARHKSSISVDLKNPRGIALLKELIKRTDVTIDPFRPGILEKLGLGPDILLELNPRLIYGRMTGFRRDGKYAAMAGHDINYLAVSGTLAMLGRAGQKPHAPVNILGDFAGGGATLAQGILLALIARQRTGKGQVVEANMVDGSSYLSTFPRFTLKTPMGDEPRGQNMLDGGSPFYDTYETKDGKYMSVGALEPQFFAELIRGLGLTGQGWEENRVDKEEWPRLRKLFEDTFKTKTRTEWEAVFDGTDACCVPVLEYAELETDAAREGDQRPAVTLRDTPCLAIHQHKSDDASPSQDRGLVASRGQGAGVPGDGYQTELLSPGDGGEDALQEWAGWEGGREYEVHDGGLVLTEKGKIAKL